MLATKSLKYQYPGQAAMEFPDIKCQQGEHWLLIGPSGSGKTSILNLISKESITTSGSIEVNQLTLDSISYKN